MDLAVAQLAGRPPQFFKELERLPLLGVDVGMKDVTPSLKASQAGAIEVCTLRGRLLPQVSDCSQQSLKRRIELVARGLIQDRHMGVEGKEAVVSGAIGEPGARYQTKL